MSESEYKRYYWLKLKEDFFDSERMSWLEEQENGKEYELFYLKLCLKSLKHNGLLIRDLGTMVVPYDIKKLAEITRTDIDTAMVAMNVFKSIGLVEIEDDGSFFMNQLSDMVGSETVGAAQKRMRRARQKALPNGKADNVRSMSANLSAGLSAICPQEYRDKSIEYRYISCSSDDERPLVEADASSSQSVTTVTEQRSNGNADTVTEGRKKKNSAAVRDELFDRFWKAYPRKVGKDAARNAWAKRKPSAALTEQMIKALEWQKKTEQWQDKNYIPHPATWLNQGRWKDERETPQEIKPAPRHRTTLTPDMKKWLAANGKRV